MGPSTWLTLIFFILIIVSQIVAKALEKAGKEQQERKMRELTAERARRAAAAREHGPATSAPVAPADQSRAETLAARRRAQLAELRSRRQTLAGEPPAELRPQQPPTTRGPAGVPGPGPATTVPRPTPFQRQAGPSPFQRGPAPIRPQAPTRPAPSPAPTATRQRVTRPEPSVLRRPPVVERAAPEEEPYSLPHPAIVKPPPDRAEDAYAIRAKRRHSLFARGATVAELRRMVVLKEVFEPPVSMREREAWDRV